MWANAWDMFHMPSRGGRGLRAALALVVCFRWGGFFVKVFFSVLFFFERTRLLQVISRLDIFTSTLVMRQGRGSEATEAIFCL